MRFYEIHDDQDEIIGCETTYAATMSLAEQLIARDSDIVFTVISFEVVVNADNMRRIIGHVGGYADSFKHYDIFRSAKGVLRSRLTYSRD